MPKYRPIQPKLACLYLKIIELFGFDRFAWHRGIKWHKQIFKTSATLPSPSIHMLYIYMIYVRSQRLVVDEIALGSPLDRWNAGQPEGLQVGRHRASRHGQVRYGDRLERLNGIRVRSSPAEATQLTGASIWVDLGGGAVPAGAAKGGEYRGGA